MFRQTVTHLVAVVAVASLASAAGEPPRPLHGDLVNGQKLFAQHCSSCHGSTGQGDKASRVSDSGRLNALTNPQLLALIREGTLPKKADDDEDIAGSSKRKNKKKKGRKAAPAVEHPHVPDDVDLMATWDIVGFMRSRTVEAPALIPEADRFIADRFSPDEFGLERLEKSLEQKFTKEETARWVFTLYKTGWGGPCVLEPNDPKLLDKLKKRMKQGYVVSTPLGGQAQPTDVVFSLDPKTYAIKDVRAITQAGAPLPDLDKQLSRFVGKGDRRLSGQPKAILKAGGGGKAFAVLEKEITRAFVVAAEAVTAYEVVERDRSWADEEL